MREMMSIHLVRSFRSVVSVTIATGVSRLNRGERYGEGTLASSWGSVFQMTKLHYVLCVGGGYNLKNIISLLFVNVFI